MKHVLLRKLFTSGVALRESQSKHIHLKLPHEIASLSIKPKPVKDGGLAASREAGLEIQHCVGAMMKHKFCLIYGRMKKDNGHM